MSSLSNTETFAFTRIPKVINKQWDRASVDPATMTASNASDRHQHSAISRISLQIEFESLHEAYKSTCRNVDDKSQDAIQYWRENRQMWTELEGAIQETLDKYVAAVRTRAVKDGNRTIDVPIMTTTQFSDSRSAPIGSHRSTPRRSHPMNIPPPVPETVLSIRTDLEPDDSASHVRFDMGDLSKLIRKEARKQRHESIESKKKRSKSVSLLSYAAGSRS